MRTRLVLGEPGGVCRSRLSSNDGGGGLGRFACSSRPNTSEGCSSDEVRGEACEGHFSFGTDMQDVAMIERSQRPPGSATAAVRRDGAGSGGCRAAGRLVGCAGGGLGGELGRVGGVCRSRLSSKDGDEGFGGELGGVPAIAQEKSSESDLNQNGYWVQLGLGRPCGTLLAKPGTQSISFPLASQDLSPCSHMRVQSLGCMLTVESMPCLTAWIAVAVMARPCCN